MMFSHILFKLLLFVFLLAKPAIGFFSAPNDLDINSNHHVDGNVDVNMGLDQETLQQANDANVNWAGTIEQMNVANANWANTNQAINGIANQWGRTNTVLETMVDPVSVGVLAASAASGMVLGAVAAHIAIDVVKYGVTKLYNFLHEAVTHKKANQKLIDDFVEASEAYEKTLRAAQKVERILKSLIDVQETLVAKDIRPTKEDADLALTELISILSYKTKLLKIEKTEHFKQQQDQNYVQSDVAYKKAKSEEARLKNLKKSLAKASQYDICELINSLYYSLVLQEDKLQEYRINMRAAEREWLRRFRKFIKLQNERTDKIYKDADKIYFDGKKATKHTVKEHLKKLKQDKKYSIFACILTVKEQRISRVSLIKELRASKKQLFKLKQQASHTGITAFKSSLRRRICENRYKIAILKAHQARSLKDYYRKEADKAKRAKSRIKSIHLKSFNTVMDNPTLHRLHPDQFADAIEAHLTLKFDQMTKDSIDFNRSAWGYKDDETRDIMPRITQARRLRSKIDKLCGY